MGRRLLLVLSLAAVCMVVVWWRDPIPPSPERLEVEAIPIAADAASRRALGPFELVGAWTLRSEDRNFRGLSGMDMLGDGRLLIVTDRGGRIELTPPGRAGTSRITPIRIDHDIPAARVDSESITRNAVTGESHIGVETRNWIGRYDREGTFLDGVYPPEMREWRENAGPEAIHWMDDGRFLVMGEGRSTGADRSFPVLMFPGAPDGGGAATISHLEMPGEYRPVGLAGLPDGRVLILGRAVSWVLRFRSVIAIADPARLTPGGLWRAQALAAINGGPLADNYEGIATETAPDGQVTVWLVSDNNEAELFQSTKLVRLAVDPAAL